MSREMFSQKKSGTRSTDDLLYDAVFVMHGLKGEGGLRELGMAHVIEAAIRNDNSYDLSSMEVIWFADWITFGKIGWELKRG